MRRFRAVLLMMLLAACGNSDVQHDAGPAGDPSAEAAAPALLPCAEFVRAVRAQAAGSRADLRAQYGEPDSLIVNTEPNRHVPDATDTIVRLHFSGTSAQLRVASGRDLLEMLEFRSNAHLPADAPMIGTARERVRATYGEPHFAVGDTLDYTCNATEAGGESVRFVFRDDSVSSVRIGFYVD